MFMFYLKQESIHYFPKHLAHPPAAENIHWICFVFPFIWEHMLSCLYFSAPWPFTVQPSQCVYVNPLSFRLKNFLRFSSLHHLYVYEISFFPFSCPDIFLYVILNFVVSVLKKKCEAIDCVFVGLTLLHPSRII